MKCQQSLRKITSFLGAEFSTVRDPCDDQFTFVRDSSPISGGKRPPVYLYVSLYHLEPRVSIVSKIELNQLSFGQHHGI